jgi:hypothetical protein
VRPSTDPATTEGGAPADPARASSSLGSRSPLDLGLELGAAWQFYGRTAAGDPGLRAGVALYGGAWSLELLGHYGWPVPARLGPAAFDLQRRALLAELGGVVHSVGAWRFGALARAGLSWLRRDNARGDGSGEAVLDAAQSADHRSPFFGVGALAEAQLVESLSLTVRSVLNVETAIPTFTLVDASGARVSSAAPWHAQPSLELGGRWRW